LTHLFVTVSLEAHAFIVEETGLHPDRGSGYRLRHLSIERSASFGRFLSEFVECGSSCQPRTAGVVDRGDLRLLCHSRAAVASAPAQFRAFAFLADICHDARWFCSVACAGPAGRADPRVAAGAERKIAGSAKFVSDLRVVYEIQSRLNKDNELPTTPESTVPQSAPGKSPGSTDGTRPTTPRQQNRANGLGRELEILATEVPVVSGQWCGGLLGRRIP